MTGFLGAEWGVGRGSEDVSEVAAALALGGESLRGPGRSQGGGQQEEGRDPPRLLTPRGRRISSDRGQKPTSSDRGHQPISSHRSGISRNVHACMLAHTRPHEHAHAHQHIRTSMSNNVISTEHGMTPVFRLIEGCCPIRLIEGFCPIRLLERGNPRLWMS